MESLLIFLTILLLVLNTGVIYFLLKKNNTHKEDNSEKILRDEIKVEVNKIPKDPTQQVKLLSENGYSIEDFSNDQKIISKLQEEVDKLNSNFSNPEQLKKFSLLNRDFSIDYGELTPTMKIRRKQILENWSEVIESMY